MLIAVDYLEGGGGDSTVPVLIAVDYLEGGGGQGYLGTQPEDNYHSYGVQMKESLTVFEKTMAVKQITGVN